MASPSPTRPTEVEIKRDPETCRLQMRSICVQYVAVNIRTKMIAITTMRWIARDARSALIGRPYSNDDAVSFDLWNRYKAKGWRVTRCDISADVEQYADSLV